jgi:hypothetical protein
MGFLNQLQEYCGAMLLKLTFDDKIRQTPHLVGLSALSFISIRSYDLSFQVLKQAGHVLHLAEK